MNNSTLRFDIASLVVRFEVTSLVQVGLAGLIKLDGHSFAIPNLQLILAKGIRKIRASDSNADLVNALLDLQRQDKIANSVSVTAENGANFLRSVLQEQRMRDGADAAPSLFWLNPDQAANEAARTNAMKTGAERSSLGDEVATLLRQLVADGSGKDVVIVNQAKSLSIFEDRGDLAGEVSPALIAALTEFSKTHAVVSIKKDEGYVLILPLPIEENQVSSLIRVMAHDVSGELKLNMWPNGSGMPGATAISIQRRMADSRFVRRYFVGNGIDVGGGGDSLALYTEFFPLIKNVFVYDMPQGDAQKLANVDDGTFDFLFSSHCLEHLRDAYEALSNWIRVVKPGGHLVVQAPDEDMYEQGNWPSRFNNDHKMTFTLGKEKSWSPVSVNVLDLIKPFLGLVRPISIVTIDHAYRNRIGAGFDQTRTPLAECGVEFILRRL